MNFFKAPRGGIIFGWGSLESIKNLEFKKIIVVTGRSSMKKFGFLDKVLEYLGDKKVKMIEGIEHDPSTETVMHGAKKMRSFGEDLDAIIALGGGSTIDAAKVMRVLYEHPGLDIKKLMFENIDIPMLKTMFIAIPSTSGTGSEVTKGAVITDAETMIKYVIGSDNIRPDIAILDPYIPMNMPPKVTAHTGMDALTHAIESYVCNKANDFTKPLAIYAIKLIFEYLQISYRHGNDKIARQEMHYASTLAGLSITNSGVGISHSLAVTGPLFNIPHGCACAIFLPYVIEYNKDTVLDKYIEIAKAIGIKEKNGKAIQKLVSRIKEINTSLGIPSTLSEFGVDEEKFEMKLEYISKEALESRDTRANPRKPTAEDMRKIYKCTFDGVNVDF